MKSNLNFRMRELVATWLCWLLVFSTLLAAAPLTACSDDRSAAGAAPDDSISRAIKQEAARQTRLNTSKRFSQAQQPQSRERSWAGKHPVLFGALLGAGVGGLGGATLGSDCGREESFCSRKGLVQIGAAAGAGVGALVGLVVGLIR